jgi:hypothetical protein
MRGVSVLRSIEAASGTSEPDALETSLLSRVSHLKALAGAATVSPFSPIVHVKIVLQSDTANLLD